MAIIDYGMGNIRSVYNAFCEVGGKAFVTNAPAELADADAMVLPGVGAFRKGMENLRQFGLVEPLLREAEGGKPLLGICLGMQLLAEEGFEHGPSQGLGLIPGKVIRLKPGDPDCRIPHMGWNEVDLPRPSPLFEGFGKHPVFYFVHSFHFAVDPGRQGLVTATCVHGQRFVAAVEQGNVAGLQFHPEKSQRAGLKLLHNFVNLVAEKRRG